ncbi:GNAT family N-acetyltransferase [Streptomyces sp. AC495_CC817]|uniref:GNAT family N-acetyltransferase n=1 Tax=Streptomyces sp. AC495_CC817 TaxID=2823900 RepID=UPI001C2599D2|nr:GNAT family N-acetyltransferase [Streptomyces sp. AC495_CC817]
MTGDSAITIEAVAHVDLGAANLDALRTLFDREYLATHGRWDPSQPYGYAPHDVHVIARAGSEVVGHVGWARRTIQVGSGDVVIAGVGGVLISREARGEGLGAALLAAAVRSMADAGGIEFGYLGCREEVVPFYVATGWHRIHAAEASVGRDGRLVDDPPGQPLLVLAVESAVERWPNGDIDLRGRAW